MNVVDFILSNQETYFESCFDDGVMYSRHKAHGREFILRFQGDFYKILRGYPDRFLLMGNTVCGRSFSKEEYARAEKEGFVLFQEEEMHNKINDFIKKHYFQGKEWLTEKEKLNKIRKTDILSIRKILLCEKGVSFDVAPRWMEYKDLYEKIKKENGAIEFFYEGDLFLMNKIAEWASSHENSYKSALKLAKREAAIYKAIMEGRELFHVTDGKKWVRNLLAIEEIQKEEQDTLSGVVRIFTGEEREILFEKKKVYQGLRTLFESGNNLTLLHPAEEVEPITFADIKEVDLKNGGRVFSPEMEILKEVRRVESKK